MRELPACTALIQTSADMSGISNIAGGIAGIIGNLGAGMCGHWGCKKALEPSSSRLRFRDVLGEEQMTGGKTPRLSIAFVSLPRLT